MTTTTEATTQVAALIEKLHRKRQDMLRVADWLADNAEALAPFFVHDQGHDTCIQARDAEGLATVARLLAAGAPVGSVRKDYGGNIARVTRMFGTVKVDGYALRENVCEQVVVGTETVEVPDPDAPTVTVEREVTRWECAPLLAAEVSA